MLCKLAKHVRDETLSSYLKKYGKCNFLHSFSCPYDGDNVDSSANLQTRFATWFSFFFSSSHQDFRKKLENKTKQKNPKQKPEILPKLINQPNIITNLSGIL